MLLDVSVPRADVYVETVRLYTTRKDKAMDVGRTVEGAVVGHIVYEQNAHCTAVVSGGDSAEALLTSGVPLEHDGEMP